MNDICFIVKWIVLFNFSWLVVLVRVSYLTERQWNKKKTLCERWCTLFRIAVDKVQTPWFITTGLKLLGTSRYARRRRPCRMFKEWKRRVSEAVPSMQFSLHSNQTCLFMNCKKDANLFSLWSLVWPPRCKRHHFLPNSSARTDDAAASLIYLSSKLLYFPFHNLVPFLDSRLFCTRYVDDLHNAFCYFHLVDKPDLFLKRCFY